LFQQHRVIPVAIAEPIDFKCIPSVLWNSASTTGCINGRFQQFGCFSIPTAELLDFQRHFAVRDKILMA
jgi:hypothetical protein